MVVVTADLYNNQGYLKFYRTIDGSLDKFKVSCKDIAKYYSAQLGSEIWFQHVVYELSA